MDGDKFHRAEVVPTYNHNYRPVPASGVLHSAILKKLAHSSKDNNVSVLPNGYRGVITHGPFEKSEEAVNYELDPVLMDDAFLLLHGDRWNQYVQEIETPKPGTKYQLGRDELHIGGFERQLVDSNDISDLWKFSKSDVEISNTVARTGQRSMKITASSSVTKVQTRQKVRIRSEHKDFYLCGYIKAENAGAIECSATFEWRGKKVRKVTSQSIDGGTFDWKSFRIKVEFSGERTFNDTVLPHFSLSPAESGESTIYLDDIVLVAVTDEIRTTGDGYRFKVPTRDNVAIIHEFPEEGTELIVNFVQLDSEN